MLGGRIGDGPAANPPSRCGTHQEKSIGRAPGSEGKVGGSRRRETAAAVRGIGGGLLPGLAGLIPGEGILDDAQDVPLLLAG
jgi:hypothetical protein